MLLIRTVEVDPNFTIFHLMNFFAMTIFYCCCCYIGFRTLMPQNCSPTVEDHILIMEVKVILFLGSRIRYMIIC